VMTKTVVENEIRVMTKTIVENEISDDEDEEN